MSLEMVSLPGTGEVVVIDWDSMMCSDLLHSSERDADLGDYNLDNECDFDRELCGVIREEVIPDGNDGTKSMRGRSDGTTSAVPGWNYPENKKVFFGKTVFSSVV